jgi:hypothetical protein
VYVACGFVITWLLQCIIVPPVSPYFSLFTKVKLEGATSGVVEEKSTSRSFGQSRIYGCFLIGELP